jgi:hypothetical protein
MAWGPGKYDDLCTRVREEAKADAAIVIVINGANGSGFSVQTDNPLLLAKLPELLEHMARELRVDGGRARPEGWTLPLYQTIVTLTRKGQSTIIRCRSRRCGLAAIASSVERRLGHS